MTERETERTMRFGDRVTWTSHIGKERAGKYITRLKTRPDFVLILGEDGKSHIMRANKPVTP